MSQKIVDELFSKLSGADFKRNRTPKIFVDAETMKNFMQEVEPIYKKQYGGFITHQGSVSEGYQNILYKGVAVCLKPLNERK